MSDLVIRNGEGFSLVPKSLAEAMEFAKLMAGSDLCPQQFRGKPADVLIAVQMGAEVGVSPLQALQNIAIINGRACMWGDLVVALAQATGELEYISESWDAATGTATARIKRAGHPENVQTFSLADARRAGLAGKQAYEQYPQRMCGWRAKSWLLRAEFADALKGLWTREEAEEIPVRVVREIVMPRAIGEPPSIESFIAPARETAPPAAGMMANPYVGAIISVTDKSGKTEKGKEYTVYTIDCEGRKFSTFSATLADKAQFLAGTGEEVRIEWEDKGKYVNAVSIEAVDVAPDAE